MNTAKLERLRRATDPHYAALAGVQDTLKGIPMIKGDPGYTPVKGVDYFTAEEVQAIIDYVQSQVHDGANGAPGENGRNGTDGAPGPRGPRGPAGESIVGPQGPAGAPGKNGKAPTLKEIVNEVLPAIKASLSLEDLAEAPDLEITSLKALVQHLKRGGFRGGGSSSSGPATSTGAVINATNTGDGKHYTLALAPTTTAYYVMINNGMYSTDDPVGGFTASGTALTFTNTLPADLQNTLIKLVCV